MCNYFNNNFNGKTDSQTEYNETIIMLEKMIRALEKEICEIKNAAYAAFSPSEWNYDKH